MKIIMNAKAQSRGRTAIKNVPMKSLPGSMQGVLWHVKERLWNAETGAQIRYVLVVGTLAGAWAVVVFCVAFWVM